MHLTITHVAIGVPRGDFWTVASIVVNDGACYSFGTDTFLPLEEDRIAEQVRIEKLRELKVPIAFDPDKVIWQKPDGSHCIASRINPIDDEASTPVEFKPLR